jgi:hypothetical protein
LRKSVAKRPDPGIPQKIFFMRRSCPDGASAPFRQREFCRVVNKYTIADAPLPAVAGDRAAARACHAAHCGSSVNKGIS